MLVEIVDSDFQLKMCIIHKLIKRQQNILDNVLSHLFAFKNQAVGDFLEEQIKRLLVQFSRYISEEFIQ